MHTKRVQQLRCQFLADVALVTDEFAEKLSGQVRHWFAVIDVTSGQETAEQFTLVIHYQV